jgi:hypothetical protein
MTILAPLRWGFSFTSLAILFFHLVGLGLGGLFFAGLALNTLTSSSQSGPMGRVSWTK